MKGEETACTILLFRADGGRRNAVAFSERAGEVAEITKAAVERDVRHRASMAEHPVRALEARPKEIPPGRRPHEQAKDPREMKRTHPDRPRERTKRMALVKRHFEPGARRLDALGVPGEALLAEELPARSGLGEHGFGEVRADLFERGAVPASHPRRAGASISSRPSDWSAPEPERRSRRNSPPRRTREGSRH